MSNNGPEHTVELREIISPIPSVFNSLIVYGIVLFVILLIGLGFIINVPEQIMAEVRVTSNISPVTLKAYSQGKIHMLKSNLPSKCEAGEYIAMIENSGSPEMIKQLKQFLDTVNVRNISFRMLSNFDKKIQLGDIEPYYFKFRESLIQLENLMHHSKYSYEMELYKEKLNSDSIYMENLHIIRNNIIKQFQIKEHTYKSDSILFSNKAILKSEFDISYVALLNVERQLISVNTDIGVKAQSILDSRIKYNELYQEFSLLVENAHRDVGESFHNLKTQIKRWENTYIFMSDKPGIVDYYNLISDASYVNVGDPVFDIVFPNSKFIGIASLNAEGSGTIQKGQHINIKLSTYPYQDYGTIDGIVDRISLNVIEDKYLLYINLPNGLISNTGKNLSFAETMFGEAEIITDKKPVIKRIYSQIFKTITNHNTSNNPSDDNK